MQAAWRNQQCSSAPQTDVLLETIRCEARARMQQHLKTQTSLPIALPVDVQVQVLHDRLSEAEDKNAELQLQLQHTHRGMAVAATTTLAAVASPTVAKFNPSLRSFPAAAPALASTAMSSGESHLLMSRIAGQPCWLQRLQSLPRAQACGCRPHEPLPLSAVIAQCSVYRAMQAPESARLQLPCLMQSSRRWMRGSA